VFDSLGREEEWRPVLAALGAVVIGTAAEGSARKGMRAAFSRMALRLVKYMAEPKPVRRADGTAPRQSAGMSCGAARISAMAALSECEPDCCTRVLRRSMGWRRTAERTPDPRPAAKWKAETRERGGQREKTLLCWPEQGWSVLWTNILDFVLWEPSDIAAFEPFSDRMTR